MGLLPGWEDRLQEIKSASDTQRPGVLIPKDPEYYAAQLTVVQDTASADAMHAFVQQQSISCVGVSAYGTQRTVTCPDGCIWGDPRSTKPLIVAVALVASGSECPKIYRFVCDLRVPVVVDALRTVLRQPAVFVGHQLQEVLFAAWTLGLRSPGQLWDTRVCERAMELGRHRINSTGVDSCSAKKNADSDEQIRLSLSHVCGKYGIGDAQLMHADRISQSLHQHPLESPFTQEQVEYVAGQAECVARLYAPQVMAATCAGVLTHLNTVEMPWVETNARMIWNGVRIDQNKLETALKSCRDNLPPLLLRLKEIGLENPHSNQQLEEFFRQRGLLDVFRRKGAYSFDKDQMKRVMHLDDSIRLIRSVRRLQDFQSDAITRKDLVGADGRLHPVHQQLGADSGRQTCRWPNVLGLDRVLRPMVVPDPGRAIGEVDLSQIEVGIAAAVYGDQQLVQMFNTGDVYSAMAQRLYRGQLSEEERDLPSGEFKQRRRDLRDKMKSCTLGIIYGLTPHGLSVYLKISEQQAGQLQQQFMAMFPQLQRALAEAGSFGSLRGYAQTNTGLKRYLSAEGEISGAERNWLTNHPVQGSAAVVFKAAGNRLLRLYEQYDAWLIIPFHDAYVFECPLEHLQAVAELTANVMCQAVQEYFPMLRPRAEINISRPDCWNKDGKADAFERWLKDPLHTV